MEERDRAGTPRSPREPVPASARLPAGLRGQGSYLLGPLGSPRCFCNPPGAALHCLQTVFMTCKERPGQAARNRQQCSCGWRGGTAHRGEPWEPSPPRQEHRGRRTKPAGRGTPQLRHTRLLLPPGTPGGANSSCHGPSASPGSPDSAYRGRTDARVHCVFKTIHFFCLSLNTRQYHQYK